MKKKLLSLVLAGAMVASTSVSAFATENKEVTVGSGETQHQVTVTGDVTNNSDQVVEGTISVTIPTAVSFRVNKNGDVDSANINITSDSDKSVQVIAYKFIDPSKDSSITVVGESELESKKGEISDTNRFVSLSIKGGSKDVVLKSTEGQKSGIFDNAGTEYELNNSPVIGEVTKNSPLKLRIEGKAGVNSTGSYVAPTNPVRDDFQLILKIKKSSSR